MFELGAAVAGLVLGFAGLAYGSHQRAWARVLELHVNALWSEREARYARRPLVAPEVCQTDERIVDALKARASAKLAERPLVAAEPAARPEPPPLDGARTLVRNEHPYGIITNRHTQGCVLPRLRLDEDEPWRS